MYGLIYSLSSHDHFSQAYDEIRKILKNGNFKQIEGFFYICEDTRLPEIFKIIKTLSNISWLKPIIKEIKVFKISDYTDFTDIIKG